MSMGSQVIVGTILQGFAKFLGNFLFFQEEEMLSTVDWKKFQIGGVVDLVVKEIIPEEGVVMETNGVSAFALLQHSQGAKVGDKVNKM